MHRLATTALCLLSCFTSVTAQSLVPAGSINEAIASKPVAVLTHDDPQLLRFVTAIRDRFFAGADLITDAVDEKARSAVVYATPEHPWFQANRERLPFVLDEAGVRIEGRTFTGDHLRVIAALRHPDDPDLRVLLYAARSCQDLVEINRLFHGPTEWVVADGTNVLATGTFTLAVRLTAAQQLADLEALVATITEVHPAAVEEVPTPVRDAAAAARAAIEANGETNVDRATFARLLAPVLLALHDAHSSLQLPASGEKVGLPLSWLPSGLCIATDCGELRAGDRVVDIAGHSPADLERRLASMVPAENEQWLRCRGASMLADLGVLQLVGVAERAPLAVRVERDGKEHTVDVGLGSPPSRPRQDWVRFDIDRDHSLGVFTLDRCDPDEHYRQVLAAFFAAVHEHGIERIAVDVRRNSGGNSAVVDQFLRYVDVADYASYSGDVRWSKPALRQRKTWGWPRFEKAAPNRVTNDRHTPAWSGRLFVLTGPNTFSSGNWFAVVVHDNDLGEIVGEPTGNAPSSYGDILTFTLPASALSYTLSFKRWVRPDPALDPADSLAPDVRVDRTPETLRSGADPVLDWLRAQR